MRVPRLLCALVLIAGIAIPPLVAGREGRVVVSAAAEPHYVRQEPGASAPRRETYTFAEGRFFPGLTRGSSTTLRNTTFMDIARTLAVDLAKQNYVPAPDPQQADLLLMVHWGMTAIHEAEDPIDATDRLNEALSSVRAAGAADQLPDVGALNEQLADGSLQAGSQARSVQQNARLLGYNVALEDESRHPFGSAREQTMLSELSEERYFVIVMAYDYRAMRTEKRNNVLWIARLSLPARGTNFSEALAALSRVGGDYFGQRHASLLRVRAPLGEPAGRRATTEIGELEVLGEAPTQTGD